MRKFILLSVILFVFVLFLGMVTSSGEDFLNLKGDFEEHFEKEAQEKREVAEKKIIDILQKDMENENRGISEEEKMKQSERLFILLNESYGKVNYDKREFFIKKLENDSVIRSGRIDAFTNLSLGLNEDSDLVVYSSNNKFFIIKYLPDQASAIALERVNAKCIDWDCIVEIKEYGKNKKVSYEIKTKKESKIFGAFDKDMEINVRVDVENGNILNVKKLWWAFLASEEKVEKKEIEESVEAPAYNNLNQYYEQIDYSCETREDCVVKNIGNACGYYPKCVNAESHTNPRFAVKASEREEINAVCGFKAVNLCSCIKNKCEGIFDPSIKD